MATRLIAAKENYYLKSVADPEGSEGLLEPPPRPHF